MVAMSRTARVKVPHPRPRAQKAAADLVSEQAVGDQVESRSEADSGLPESPCGKTEPHAPHGYTYTTGFYLTGFHCPGVKDSPVAPPDYVSQQQLNRVHDAWWDFWISDSDWHRTVHQIVVAVLVVQTLAILWLTLQVLGG